MCIYRERESCMVTDYSNHRSLPQQHPLDLISRDVPFKMVSPYQLLAMASLLILIHGVLGRSGGFRDDSTSFDQNYAVTWGNNNILRLDRGREIQLSMDKSSGSGFASKLTYGSGLFHVKIKLPSRNTAGVVTAYYLSSNHENHDELDFEFLGNKEGKPWTLQTNVFANGVGNREQRMHLWFDPTKDFHSYGILWNPYQIVFFVDEVPIRVFKNNTRIGVPYPSRTMQIIASLWNGEDWATDGGRTKTDWSYAPFKANFRGFDVDGCPASGQVKPAWGCSSPKFWWNDAKRMKLDQQQEEAYRDVKAKYVIYDYCTDRSRYPTLPPECRQL